MSKDTEKSLWNDKNISKKLLLLLTMRTPAFSPTPGLVINSHSNIDPFKVDWKKFFEGSNSKDTSNSIAKLRTSKRTPLFSTGTLGGQGGEFLVISSDNFTRDPCRISIKKDIDIAFCNQFINGLEEMIPAEFSLQLQHGITGGFAPPTPQAIFTLTKASTDEFLLVTSAVRPIGIPSLRDGGTRALSIDDAKTQTLINELYSILKVLPTEEGPIGIEDIYRLDTSISWGSEGFWWSNSGPQGCGRGVSSVQPTREERVKFGRAVEIINDLVERADAT